jgi:Domain of unknown function (DUF4268)
MSLGRLQQIDLRKIWSSEPGDFTPWLARESNLSLLADTLGMDLELEAQEKGVGPYRADLVCRDLADGTLVLIENQLEKTDHTHLGQLMTYAAGLDAVTIIWIAERFTDEHRAAIDWLNEVTNDNVGFFGLEIELWRIDDSPVAPKFNIVCKPNDWTKGGSGRSGGSSASSETKLLQQEYWRDFRESLAERKSALKPQKAQPQHWLVVSIGRSNFHLAALVWTSEDCIGVELYLSGPNAKRHFKNLEASKSEIEADIGCELEWQELPSKQASRILLRHPASNLRNKSDWPKQHRWLADTLEKFSSVFKSRVLALSDGSDEENEA